jgi:predicted nuclease of predicted toxin-antitoxin system
MKLLFDQNISFQILKYLPKKYSGSTSVKSEGLIDAPDLEIWKFARQHCLAIVTQDSDFNDLALIEGHPPKIIWIRLGNLRTHEIIEVLEKFYREIELFILDPEHSCFEIIE